jgi:hypothetical protein
MLLAEVLLPDRQQCLQAGSEQRVFLSEAKVMPEPHLSEGGDSTDNWWYLDNGASNHMTGDL